MTTKLTIVFILAALSLSLVRIACPRPAPGSFQERLKIGTEHRTCWMHVPIMSDDKARLPLLIALHPFTGTGRSMERMSGFSTLAEREGFIVAYPDAHQRVWNANPASPSSIVGPPADDVMFISALIEHMVQKYHADPDRVYIAGASSGGLMAHRTACALTERLAAAASVMITLPEDWEKYNNPSRPLPFLMMQGTADPFFPWEGGTVHEGPSRQQEYLSAGDSVLFWVRQNKADAAPTEIQLPDTDPNDGTAVYRQDYAPAPNGAEVVFWGIPGGGHTWPGSSDTMFKFLVGQTCQDISAAQVLWDFFKNHTRSAL